MDLGFTQERGSPQERRRDATAILHASGQAEAAALLLDCLHAGDPIVVMTGASGLGKTVVLDATLAQLGAEPRVLRLAAPFPTAPALQRRLAEKLRLAEPDEATAAHLASVIMGLPEPESGAASLAVVVDDAESMPVPLLHYLWLMHSIVCQARPVLQLILVGRDALWRRLGEERLDGLRRGVTARLAMQPLSAAEAEALLRHLLKRHGRHADPEALTEMQLVGKGVPGRLVTLLGAACAGLPRGRAVTLDRVRLAMGKPPVPVRPGRRLRKLNGVAQRMLRRHATILGAGAAALLLAVLSWRILGSPEPMRRTPVAPVHAAPPPRPAELPPDPAAAATHSANPPVLPGLVRDGGEKNATAAPSPSVSPSATGTVGPYEPGQRPEVPDFAVLQARIGSAVAVAKGMAARAGDMMARADISLASLAPSVPAVPASPPPVVPPAAVGIHVQAEYPALDQVAEARARWAVGVLRAAGFDVTDPVAISGRTFRAGVGYFARGDRGAAKAVAHALAAAGRPVYVRQLHRRPDARPPGTIELLFATP